MAQPQKVTPPAGYTLQGSSQSDIQPPAGYTLQTPSPAGNTAASSPRSTEREGFFRNYIDSTGLSELGNAVAHPIATANTVLDAGRRLVAPGQPEHMADNPNPLIGGIGRMVDNSRHAVREGVDSYRQNGLTPETRRDFGRAIPIVGPAFEHAQQRYDAGDTPGAVGTLLGTATGLAGPELLKAAPRVAGGVLGRIGEGMQESGASRMDKFLNGGKVLPEGEYRAPGQTVLDAGPGTSIAASRPALTTKITSAKRAAGPAIDAAAASSSGRIQIPDIRQSVDSVIDPMKQTASGPLGSRAMVDRLDEVRDSFGPNLNLNGSVSAPGVLDLTRKMDQNINWNRGPDPLVATTRNAGRQIRGKVRGLLYDAAPEVKAPSERYANLADAEELSSDNQGVRDVRFNSVPRTLSDLVIGGTTGAVTHNPIAGAAAGVLSHGLPMLWKQPLVQTGLATGAYQLGRGIESVAPYTEAALGGATRVVRNAVPEASQRLLPPLIAAPSRLPGIVLPLRADSDDAPPLRMPVPEIISPRRVSR